MNPILTGPWARVTLENTSSQISARHVAPVRLGIALRPWPGTGARCLGAGAPGRCRWSEVDRPDSDADGCLPSGDLLEGGWAGDLRERRHLPRDRVADRGGVLMASTPPRTCRS